MVTEKNTGRLVQLQEMSGMSDTSSFLKGVSEFRGILTLWLQAIQYIQCGAC